MNCANRTVEKIGSRCFIDSLYGESLYRGGRFGCSYVMTCGNSARDIVIWVSIGGRFVKRYLYMAPGKGRFAPVEEILAAVEKI